MSIIAKKPESTFTPCPEGLHHAVCVDVVDLGIVPTTWGEKHKVRIVWQIADEDPTTKRRFEARKLYTLSLHEKANLRKDLETWRAKKFTDEETRGFDLEKLLTVNCQIQVVHDSNEDGKTFANVNAIVPPPKGIARLEPKDYTRQKDRRVEQTREPGSDDGDVGF